jgi:hypothetical protein
LLERGVIRKEEKVVIFNTGAGQKYPESVKEELGRVDIRGEVEWGRM